MRGMDKVLKRRDSVKPPHDTGDHNHPPKNKNTHQAWMDRKNWWGATGGWHRGRGEGRGLVPLFPLL
jgi:hypothetical protein